MLGAEPAGSAWRRDVRLTAGRIVARLDQLLARTHSRAAVLALLLVVASGLGAVTWDGLLGDLTFFARAGDDVLAGRWSQVFADPAVQAGPVALVLSAALVWIGEATTAVLGLPLLVLGAVTGTRLLRMASGLPRRPLAELVAGIAMLLWEFNQGALHSGHLAQAIVPALSMTSAVAARRDRAVLAGLLLATAAGCETWAVLGVPVLLLAPRASSWLRGGGALLAGTTVLYLPFVLSGPFRMFEFQWGISPASAFSELAPGLFTDGFPWWARCGQAFFAVLAATAVVLLRRTDPVAIWAAPLAAVLVRLTLDPVDLPYYWTAAVILLLAGLVTTSSRCAWVAGLLCWWQFEPLARSWSGTGLVSLPGFALILLLASDRVNRSQRFPTTQLPTPEQTGPPAQTPPQAHPLPPAQAEAAHQVRRSASTAAGQQL